MLPQAGPIPRPTFNYAVIEWPKGPRVQGTPDELAAAEHGLPV